MPGSNPSPRARTQDIERVEVHSPRIDVGLDGNYRADDGRTTAARLHLSVEDVDGAMLRLEPQAVIIAFQLRPHKSTNEAVGGAIVVSSRNPSSTIGRLRKGEPVTAKGSMRFPIPMATGPHPARVCMEGGVAGVVKQLGGFKAAASPGETWILRASACEISGGWTDSV